MFMFPMTSIAGGSIEAKLLGTSTGTNMFSDKNGTVIGNSVDINSAGFPEKDSSIVNIFLQADIEYSFILKNSGGTEVMPSKNYVYRVDSSVVDNTSDVDGSTLNDALNTLGAPRGDFVPDTGGSRNVAEGDFGGAVRKFTHASDIVLTLAENTIGANKGIFYAYYPESQNATIKIAKSGSVTLEGEIGEKTPGTLLSVMRMAANEFLIKGC